jgi:hypothetical protein
MTTMLVSRNRKADPRTLRLSSKAHECSWNWSVLISWSLFIRTKDYCLYQGSHEDRNGPNDKASPETLLPLPAHMVWSLKEHTQRVRLVGPFRKEKAVLARHMTWGFPAPSTEHGQSHGIEMGVFIDTGRVRRCSWQRLSSRHWRYDAGFQCYA